ncbi:MAG: hypothetical protein HY815_16610 [Candidatus Riflebacteria bacterium]|nr:hypothetical protein [Candidatus Riflebacteria bacterium]
MPPGSAAERATRSSPLAFLLEEPARTAFIRGSLSPDMTVSTLTGRKADPAYDRQFHSRALARRLIGKAAARGDGKALGFALGWLGHLEADRSMSRPGGIIYLDLFGLPAATRKRIARTLTAINKFTVDAILIRELSIQPVVPYVDLELVLDCLQAPRGGRLDRPGARRAVTAFVASYEWTCSVLHTMAREMGANRRAFPELTEVLSGPTEEGVEIPGFDEAVQGMERALAASVPADLDLGNVETDSPPTPRTAAPGILARATTKAASLTSRGGRYLWGGTDLARSLRQAAVEQALRLVNSLGGPGSVAQRVLVTFFLDMVNETYGWPQVRARVKKIVQGIDDDE